MKELLKNLIIVHFIGAGLSYYYFDYEYKNNNSFKSSFFLSHISSIGKSLVWEFYVAEKFIIKETTDKKGDSGAILARMEIGEFSYDIVDRGKFISSEMYDNNSTLIGVSIDYDKDGFIDECRMKGGEECTKSVIYNTTQAYLTYTSGQ